LLFIATTADRTIRAFDKDSGNVLWEKEMEANFAGIPAVYAVAGRQYVAFFGGCCEKPAAGNIAWKGASLGTQGYYVFALPKTD
jgi:glucose dehydrogenase